MHSSSSVEEVASFVLRTPSEEVLSARRCEEAGAAAGVSPEDWRGEGPTFPAVPAVVASFKPIQLGVAWSGKKSAPPTMSLVCAGLE